jgi:hypothetical protein
MSKELAEGIVRAAKTMELREKNSVRYAELSYLGKNDGFQACWGADRADCERGGNMSAMLNFLANMGFHADRGDLKKLVSCVNGERRAPFTILLFKNDFETTMNHA